MSKTGVSCSGVKRSGLWLMFGLVRTGLGSGVCESSRSTGLGRVALGSRVFCVSPWSIGLGRLVVSPSGLVLGRGRLGGGLPSSIISSLGRMRFITR